MSLQSKSFPWAFIALAGTVYLVFAIIPILGSFWYSLFEWETIRPEAKVFCGVKNFLKILLGRDGGVFWLSLFHNIVLLVLSLCIQLPLAFLLALILTGRVWGKGLFRTLYFAPMMMSTVAVGVLWENMLNYDYGLINELLRWMRLGEHAYPWLGKSPAVALLSIVGVISWRFVGFHMIILMAGLESIPKELYESAYVDGASARQRFLHITLPLMQTPLKICATLSIIGSLRYFDIVWVMTQGDVPGPHDTELVATYMYKEAFKSFDGGLGSAIAVSLFVLTMLVSIAFLGAFRKK